MPRDGILVREYRLLGLDVARTGWSYTHRCVLGVRLLLCHGREGEAREEAGGRN